MYKKKRNKRKELSKKTSHIGIAHQITVAEAILTEKEINCSPPCSQGPPKDNVPEVVLMAALGIRRCHGCKGKILKQNCQPLQRSSVLDARSSNMENKGSTRLATMLWKCLFSLKNLTMNLQFKTSQWLLTHLHYFHKTTCAFFSNRTCWRQYFRNSKSSKYI